MSLPRIRSLARVAMFQQHYIHCPRECCGQYLELVQITSGYAEYYCMSLSPGECMIISLLASKSLGLYADGGCG